MRASCGGLVKIMEFLLIACSENSLLKRFVLLAGFKNKFFCYAVRYFKLRVPAYRASSQKVHRRLRTLAWKSLDTDTENHQIIKTSGNINNSIKCPLYLIDSLHLVISMDGELWKVSLLSYDEWMWGRRQTEKSWMKDLTHKREHE